jgi:hypothetical protein
MLAACAALLLAACAPGPSRAPTATRPTNAATATQPPAQPLAAPSPGATPPANYLPLDAELPVGFRHVPERDRDVALQAVSGVLRTYAQPNDPAALLQVGVTACTSEQVATGVFVSTAASWKTQGYEYEPLPGLGDEALVGRAGATAPNAQTAPAVIVYFRRGTHLGVVQWSNPAQPPAVVDALGIAQAIDKRLLGLGER